jgi:uncharacterized protein
MAALKIMLGTAQFGLLYGVNNRTGKLSEKDIFKLLAYGLSQGIDTLDTADAYGNATDIIGEFHKESDIKFKVITKFKNLSPYSSLDSWLDLTLNKLNVPTLFACMFHSFDDYSHNPATVSKLHELYKKGRIKNIGVSIYTNDQFEKTIDDPAIQLIQLPYNLLDNSYYRGLLLKKAKERGKTIHVRSVFLQGLFFINPNELPKKLQKLKPELTRLTALSEIYNMPMQSMALNYVSSNPNIDGLIIGVDNLSQLQANIEALGMDLPQALIEQIDVIKTKHSDLLNPVNWI